MPQSDTSKLPARDLPERMAQFVACSPATSLNFDGRRLLLKSPAIVKAYQAASGKLGPDSSVKAQQDGYVGTIPAGSYWIDPEQMWDAHWYERLVDGMWYVGAYTATWGLHRITIHPLPSTQTYGRGGFFIHGGTHLGSAGCIHLVNGGLETFLVDLKAALGDPLPRCSVPLTVQYP